MEEVGEQWERLRYWCNNIVNLCMILFERLQESFFISKKSKTQHYRNKSIIGPRGKNIYKVSPKLPKTLFLCLFSKCQDKQCLSKNIQMAGFDHHLGKRNAQTLSNIYKTYLIYWSMPFWTKTLLDRGIWPRSGRTIWRELYIFMESI